MKKLYQYLNSITYSDVVSFVEKSYLEEYVKEMVQYFITGMENLKSCVNPAHDTRTDDVIVAMQIKELVEPNNESEDYSYIETINPFVTSSRCTDCDDMLTHRYSLFFHPWESLLDMDVILYKVDDITDSEMILHVLSDMFFNGNTLSANGEASDEIIESLMDDRDEEFNEDDGKTVEEIMQEFLESLPAEEKRIYEESQQFHESITDKTEALLDDIDEENYQRCMDVFETLHSHHSIIN